MNIDISNINSYYYTTNVEVNSIYCSKEFYCKGATWTIKIENITNSSMDIKISYNGNPINSSVRLSINNGNNNEYFNINRKNHYIHNYRLDEFYSKSFCLYKFEYDSIENIHEITVGITLIKDSTEYSYLQYISEKVIPENYILLPKASTFNSIYIHEINNKQYIYCKYVDQINNYNNFIPEYFDVEFEVGKYQKIIKAHRVILASRCSTFKDLFEEQMSVNSDSNNYLKIALPDEDYLSFKALIDYLYKGKCYIPKSKKVIDNLLNLAYQYQVNNLIESIEEEISEHANIYTEDKNEINEADVNEDKSIDLNLNNKEIHLFTFNNSIMAKRLKYQEYSNNQLKRKRDLNEIDESKIFKDQLKANKRRHSNDKFEITRINEQGDEYYESVYYNNIEESGLMNGKNESNINIFNNIHIIEKEPSLEEESILNEMDVIHDDSENSDQQPSKEVNVEIIDIETGLSESSSNSDEKISENDKNSEDFETNVIEINESSNETLSNEDEIYEIADNSIEHIEYEESQDQKEDGYENEGEEIEEEEEDSYNDSEKDNIEKEKSYTSSSSSDTESDEIQQEDDN
eukprot:jgi/Orpsp1_1/1189503/evm.model.d7180000072502.1